MRESINTRLVVSHGATNKELDIHSVEHRSIEIAFGEAKLLERILEQVHAVLEGVALAAGESCGGEGDGLEVGGGVLDGGDGEVKRGVDDVGAGGDGGEVRGGGDGGVAEVGVASGGAGGEED